MTPPLHAWIESLYQTAGTLIMHVLILTKKCWTQRTKVE